MDDFVDHVCAILSAQISGNNDQVQESLPALTAVLSDPVRYCRALIAIIQSRNLLAPVAITILPRQLEVALPSFTADDQRALVAALTEFAQLASELSTVCAIVQLLISILRTDEEFEAMLVPGSFPLGFQLELCRSLASKAEFRTFVEARASGIVGIARCGLNGAWRDRISAMQIVSLLFPIAADLVILDLGQIVQMANDVACCEEPVFLSYWTELSAILALAEIPRELSELFDRAIPPIVEAQHLSGYAKLTAIDTIAGCVSGLTELWPGLVDYAFRLAADALDSLGDIRDPLISICGRAIPELGPDAFFDFAQKFASQSSAAMKVSLVSLTAEIETLGELIRFNWQWFSSLFEGGSRRGDPLFDQLVCHFLSELTDDFERELLSSRLFLPILVPLLVDDHSDTAFSARDALFKLIECVDSPVPGLVTAVWSVSGSVSTEPYLYLALLARGIENQGLQFPDDAACAMADFAVRYLRGDDRDVCAGALAVATVLLLRDEALHAILLSPTFSVLFDCIDEDDETVCQSALARLASLAPVFRTEIVGDPARVAALRQLLQSTSPAVRENVLLACLALMPDLDFAGEVIDCLSDAPAIPFHKYAHFLPPEEAVRAIAGGEPTEEWFDSLAAVAKNATDDRLIWAVSRVAEEFLGCCGSASDRVLNSFSELICQLLPFSKPANRRFFEFAMEILERLEDAGLSVLADGVQCGAWSSDELSVIQQIAERARADISVDRIHSHAFLLFTAIRAGLVDAEAVWDVVAEWLSGVKKQGGNALLTVVELVWEISVRNSHGREEFVKETLQLFPPPGSVEPAIMCELIGRMGRIHAVEKELAAGIARLLCLPRMLHRQMGVADDCVVQLARLLRELVDGREWAQEVLGDSAGASEIRCARLMGFLGGVS
jgi:hypothetical protein